VALYNKNRLSVTRQLRYSPKRTDELDLTLLVNGLPVATAELKHALAGQTVTDAIAQYRTDRDPKDLLLQFKKRVLVHFDFPQPQLYLCPLCWFLVADVRTRFWRCAVRKWRQRN
jgi:type I restriction enzyme R subunit